MLAMGPADRNAQHEGGCPWGLPCRCLQHFVGHHMAATLATSEQVELLALQQALSINGGKGRISTTCAAHKKCAGDCSYRAEVPPWCPKPHAKVCMPRSAFQAGVDVRDSGSRHLRVSQRRCLSLGGVLPPLS